RVLRNQVVQSQPAVAESCKKFSTNIEVCFMGPLPSRHVNEVNFCLGSRTDQHLCLVTSRSLVSEADIRGFTHRRHGRHVAVNALVIHVACISRFSLWTVPVPNPVKRATLPMPIPLASSCRARVI